MRALAVVIALAGVAHGDPDRIALRDAIGAAVAKNPRLGMATMDVIAAEGDATYGAGAYDPVLEAQTGAAADRRDPNGISPFAQNLTDDRVVGSAAIKKQFERGSRVALEVTATASHNVVRAAQADGTSDMTLDRVTPRLALEWVEPFAGGRRTGGAERRRHAATRDAAASERAAVAAAVLRDVERAYWELYLAERALEIRRESRGLAEDQLKLVRAEIERGTRARLAAAEVEDELARRVEDAMLAEGALAERSLDLARLIGLPPTTALRSGDEPAAGSASRGPADLAAALARSPAIAAAVAQGDAAAAALDRAADDTRWRIDLYLRGSASAESDELDDSLVRTAGYSGWTAEAGVQVRIPLGSRQRRGAIDAARARLVRARLQVAEREADTAAEVTREQHRLAIAVRRRQALARSVELAELNLAAERKRWERGDGTSFEVLRRQTALAEARLRAERARVDELAARAGLDAITGAILARHHVELR